MDGKMKTLILDGGPRRKGVSSDLTATVAGVLEQRGNEVVTERIYALDVKPCVGCLKCRPDKPCALPEDDAHRIAGLIDESDMLVLASPTFWGNISGPMKTLVDRLVPVFEHIDPEVGRIPVKMQKGKDGIIITCSNAPAGWHLLPSQSRGAVRAMKTILGAGGYRIRKVINVPDSSRYGRRAPRIRKRIERALG
jgi:multimeric flavodoxin WrbA